MLSTEDSTDLHSPLLKIHVVSSINIIFYLLMTALIYHLPSCIDHLLSTEDIVLTDHLLSNKLSTKHMQSTEDNTNHLSTKNSTDHLQSTEDTTGHML